jgi:hypothetical protein
MLVPIPSSDKKYTSENSNIEDKTVIKNVWKLCCSYSKSQSVGSRVREQKRGGDEVIEDLLKHDDLQVYKANQNFITVGSLTTLKFI